jgi:putative NADPH-quinone reductase
VIIYPLWLGTMPALLKAFFEQTLRPGFALKAGEMSLHPGLLTGRSVRIIVMMGMPALVYRWYFFAHSLKSMERNILRFCGLGPIRETLIGSIESIGDEGRRKWLERIRGMGSRAQ